MDAQTRHALHEGDSLAGLWDLIHHWAGSPMQNRKRFAVVVREAVQSARTHRVKCGHSPLKAAQPPNLIAQSTDL
jgi:hypothetical protein